MNLRPEFLTRPHDWTRSSRTGQSPADYACAVQHNVRPAKWHPAELVFMAMAVLFLIFLF